MVINYSFFYDAYYPGTSTECILFSIEILMGLHVKNGPQYLSRDDVDEPFRSLYHNTSSNRLFL